MSELLNSEAGWLNIVNAALGLAVLICLVAVGRVLIQDIRNRIAERRRSPVLDGQHTFNLTSLGITLADGGELIDEASLKLNHRPPDEDIPPNIVRSEN